MLAVQDIYFITDIFLNFRTAFPDARSGLLIFEQRRITWNYVTGARLNSALGSQLARAGC